jgi:single-stranded DNA-binding protein
LAAQPAPAESLGREVIEVFAATNGKDPVNVLLRTSASSSAAEALKAKQAGDFIVVAGDVFLEDDQPTIYVRTVCEIPKDCYLNEVCIAGRMVGEARVSDSNKSAVRKLPVSRYVKSEEITDWFNVRGYGSMMERLVDTPSGSLVFVTGSLNQLTSRDGSPYCEIRGRTIRVFRRGTGASGVNQAEGTKAAGYSHKDFADAANDMPFDWSN